MNITELGLKLEDGQDVLDLFIGALNAAVRQINDNVAKEVAGLRETQTLLTKELRDHIDTHLPRRPRRRIAES